MKEGEEMAPPAAAAGAKRRGRPPKVEAAPETPHRLITSALKMVVSVIEEQVRAVQKEVKKADCPITTRLTAIDTLTKCVTQLAKYTFDEEASRGAATATEEATSEEALIRLLSGEETKR